MPCKLEKKIEELSFRVRLYIESTEARQPFENITERDIVILEFLEEKGEVGFSELADFFKRVSPSTVSNIMKNLYRKNLVNRREKPDDLRSNIFSLTDDGRRFLEPIKREQEEFSKAIADSFQLTSEESELVAEVVARATQKFNEWLGLQEVPAGGEHNNPDRSG